MTVTKSAYLRDIIARAQQQDALVHAQNAHVRVGLGFDDDINCFAGLDGRGCHLNLHLRIQHYE